MPKPSPSVLITGACGDIGRALAMEFAKGGARLALCDLLTSAKARVALAPLKARGTEFLYRQVDVTDVTAMKAFATQAARTFGGIGVCLANAGIVERGELIDLSLKAWRRTLDVNLTGCFVTAQAVARVMAAKGGGHIVFTSSWTQDQPRAGIGAYCASKGGLKMLAKCLALELGPKGIRVNLVAPGWVDAGLTRHNLEKNPALRAEMESQIPLGRLIPADEFARTVRMLCSDDAQYLTGATLLVDGGSSLIFRKPPRK
jgi:NAD(P)-dependent dehydrogenase (short-subunit alcohol dehydrogenase family)